VLPQSTPTLTPTPILDATGIADPGPFVMDGSHCGIQLPLVATPELATDQIANPNPSLMDVPGQVRPAVAFMLANPEKVGLAAYEVGREGEGVYLNADNPLPLASVVKVLHLVSYARAVQVGELDPDTVVPLAELERYYLPNSDLGSHPRAVAALVSEERVFGDPPAILLEDVPRMMIEFSSNAAADYLHMLLGQQRIEETAIALGFARQTAPCPFLGQFLLMGHRDEGLAPVTKLVQDLPRYSREVMAVTEQYSGDQEFRDEAGGWQRANRPTIEAQQLFSEQLNPHGSAREYANLMAQIALNTLGPWEESVRIRRYLEWPTHFTENQERLAWLGYKGGSLPGVLTVVYYAQPWDTTQPVVVALFYHDLPLETYREWRRSLPHDELARWLLRDRRAIPMIRDLLG
jgi:D-alanyl-D-alanine carboxypeptidase